MVNLSAKEGLKGEAFAQVVSYEALRMKLTYRYLGINLIFSLLFACYLVALHSFNSASAIGMNAAGLLLALIMLKSSGNVRPASIVFFITNLISTSFFVLSSPGDVGVLNGMWFILLGVYSYFNLGKSWGRAAFVVIILIFNPVAYLKFSGFESWVDPGYGGMPYHISILVTLVVAFSLLFYFITETIDARKDLTNSLLISQKRLLESENRQAALLKALPDRMYRISREGAFLDFNFGTDTEIMLMPKEAIISQTIDSIPGTALQKKLLRDALTKALETGELQTYETEILWLSKGLRSMEMRIISVSKDEVVCIARDVTEKADFQKKLQESIHFNEQILSATPSFIWIRDYATGESVFTNKELTDSLGYSEDEIRNMGNESTRKLLHPDDLDYFVNQTQVNLRTLKDGEVSTIEYRMKNAFGYWRWIQARRVVFKRNEQGEATQLLSVGEDITTRKENEERLKVALEEARQATLAKSQFLATMSHEIRTPLNAVVGFTYLLKDENPRPDQLEALDALSFSSNHLLALINDILDISKIEAGKIKFEDTAFSLTDMLKGIKNIFSLKAAERNLELAFIQEADMPAFLVGDSVRLNQVLTNLVGNAVKFTLKGKVIVECSILNQSGKNLTIQFRISDTGIGIPKEMLESIFDSFTQAGSDTTRKFGGTGLGLAISKKLVELQGGELTVESAPGVGSVFSFSLPFKTGEKGYRQEILPGQVDEKKDLLGLRVLVAEDNVINVMIIRRFLEKWGAIVWVASNGSEAVNLVANNEFDIVLMDLQMPEMDGYEAVSIIRDFKGEKYETLPIIALTANAFLEMQTEVLDKGLMDYASKPFNPDQLYQLIYKYGRNYSRSV